MNTQSVKTFGVHVREYPVSGMVAVLALLVTTLVPRFTVGERLELPTHDVRFLLRGSRTTQARIVIADVDNDTEAQWKNEPVAFWSGHYANIVANARKLNARAVGLDIVPNVGADDYLDSVNAKGERPDVALARAVQEAGGMVALSAVLNTARSIEPIDTLRFLPETENRIGFANLPQSPDGVVRRSFLFMETQGDGAPATVHLQPALSALLAQMHRKASPHTTGTEWRRLTLDRATPLQRERQSFTQADGKIEGFWINYTGKSFPKISAWKLEQWQTLPQAEQNEIRKIINGATVLVGVSFAGTQDFHAVPVGAGAKATGNGGEVTGMAGVVVQAHALATLLDGRTLWRLSPNRETLLTLGLGMLALAVAVGFGFGRGLFITVALAAIHCLLAQTVFQAKDGLLPVAGPLLALTVPWLVFHTARSVEENRRRLQAEMIFGRYVSPQIRDYILQDPLHQRPGGTLREATILFLDMRGSTVYGEKKDPVLLLHDLNEFFGVIVPIVERTGGLLYRYTGDGFLAVFGAPTPPPPGVDHAYAALEAAGALAHAVREAGRKRAAQGLTAWRIGCSVHTGHVACGNLGTADRPDFTVIGDAVNLCAKMEEGNKGHCSDIVVSEATMERLRPSPEDAPRLPPQVPEAFLVESAHIGKRAEPTLVYYFCLPEPVVPEPVVPESQDRQIPAGHV